MSENIPTDAMASNAERGLRLRREFGRGGTAVGVARARDISNKKNLSDDTVLRMHSFFSRHEVDKQGQGFNAGEPGYPSNGLIAWLLWGGDSGKTWAESKRNAIMREREKFSTSDDLEKAPAPPKDRISGSSKNPEGSASGSRGGIEFTESIKNSLRLKAKEHNERMSSRGRPTSTRTNYGVLASVYRRGAGAYSTSHRPGVSRGAWAMARVNAFLYLLSSGRPKNSNYVTDNDLLPSGHPKHSESKKSMNKVWQNSPFNPLV